MVRSSFGAIRIQQLSHQTLSSALAFSTFAFTVCPGFICITGSFWKRETAVVDLHDGDMQISGGLQHEENIHQTIPRWV
jgi:hypothetical protein